MSKESCAEVDTDRFKIRLSVCCGINLKTIEYPIVIIFDRRNWDEERCVVAGSKTETDTGMIGYVGLRYLDTEFLCLGIESAIQLCDRYPTCFSRIELRSA